MKAGVYLERKRGGDLRSLPRSLYLSLPRSLSLRYGGEGRLSLKGKSLIGLLSRDLHV